MTRQDGLFAPAFVRIGRKKVLDKRTDLVFNNSNTRNR